MIGQTKLLERILKLEKNFPQFTIFVGPKGSGKKTLVNELFTRLSIPVHSFTGAIDDVRRVIDIASEQREPICYLLPDADNMSVNAKNALLKITEEPPANAYFVITLLDANNTLGTILSRGTCFNLDPYGKEELRSYILYKQYNTEVMNIALSICNNTGEINELFSYDVKAFYKFAETIVNNIHIPKTGNIFKISKQVKGKDNPTGYDGTLLFKVVRNLYLQKAIETDKPQYYNAVLVTSKCLRDLSLVNVNVVGTIDTWIMEVRSVLGGV